MRSRPASRKQLRRGAGELEADVLGVLWSASGSMTPTEVQAALGSGLAYNTIQTILTRLHDKGLLGRERVGRGYTYRPRQGGAEFAANQMGRALRARADRRAVLQRFVTALEPEDADLLRTLLAGEAANRS